MALQIDRERCEVTLDGKEVRLYPKEFDILVALHDADGRVLTRDHIMENVLAYKEPELIDTRTVDQHVSRLRRKLGRKYAAVIRTVTTRGYKFKALS